MPRRQGFTEIDTREGGLPCDLVIFAPNHPEGLVPMLMRGGTLSGGEGKMRDDLTLVVARGR